MIIFNSNKIAEQMLEHPVYESNPDYKAKVCFLYMLNSGEKDNKIISGIWEASIGWFDYEFKGNNEIAYIIDGEIEIISNGKTMVLKPGDSYLMEDGDNVRYNIKKKSKIFYVMSPIKKKIKRNFKNN